MCFTPRPFHAQTESTYRNSAHSIRARCGEGCAEVPPWHAFSPTAQAGVIIVVKGPSLWYAFAASHLTLSLLELDPSLITAKAMEPASGSATISHSVGCGFRPASCF